MNFLNKVTVEPVYCGHPSNRQKMSTIRKGVHYKQGSTITGDL